MRRWWALGATVAIAATVPIVRACSAGFRPPAAAHQQAVTLQKTKPAIQEESDVFGSMDVPQTLAIPSLHITSTVRPVGTTPDGEMDIPRSLVDAGWYQQSVHPGDPGKAVMAVHTGYPNKPSQFRQLEQIQPGAAVTVKDRVGSTAYFRVIQIAKYNADEAPRGAIFGDSPTARLNIITCTGTWDPASQTYAERLVVFTAREQ